MFLIWKASKEIHESIEGEEEGADRFIILRRYRADYAWIVIFSLKPYVAPVVFTMITCYYMIRSLYCACLVVCFARSIGILSAILQPAGTPFLILMAYPDPE